MSVCLFVLPYLRQFCVYHGEILHMIDPAGPLVWCIDNIFLNPFKVLDNLEGLSISKGYMWFSNCISCFSISL